VFVCGLFAAAVTALTHPQAADEPALDLVSSS
jgi:hypothetical protein